MWQNKVQTPFPKMHVQIKEENVTQPKALSIILIIILYIKKLN
jgi:hypothetical protein